MRVLTFLILGLCFLISGCSSGKSPESAARDYCVCAKPMLDKMGELNEAMTSGNLAALQTMSTELQGLQPQMESCMKDLEGKYGNLRDKPEFQKSVLAEIDKQCPNPIAKMGQAMQGMMGQ